MTTNNETHTPPIKENAPSEMRQSFEIRRALLEEAPVPDVDKAFKDFMKRNGNGQRHKRKVIKTTIAMLVATAACFIGLLIITTHKNHGEVSPQHTTLARLGNVIYEAQPNRQCISISFDGKTIDLNSNASKQGEGITINDNNEIQVFGVSKDNHELTTLSVPQGKQAKIMLDDGTTIWMNADSKITFPRHFYENGPREVTLEGEACFEIAHEENRPFIVTCGNVKTTDLGTKFNIRSYKESPSTITLINGKIDVNNGKQKAVLYPEEAISISEKGDMNLITADMDVTTSWMNGLFYFDGQSLQEILTEIGRWYNVNVVFTTNKHLNEKLHLNTERDQDIQAVIKQIRMICSAKIQLTNKALIVD